MSARITTFESLLRDINLKDEIYVRRVPLLKIGTVIHSQSANQAVKLGILAEKLNFDSVWITDHLIDGPSVDPWTTLSAISVGTSRIFLCSHVTDTQRCHPAKTAQIVATLDRISNGRVGLGIGAGEALNIVPFGLMWEKPIERRKRLAEAIQVIKLLWKSNRQNPACFRGIYYNLQNAWLDQQVPKPPPIYVGSFGARKTLEIIGHYGDGWDSFLNTPETFRNRVETIRAAARHVGRNPDDIDPVATILTIMTEDQKDLERAINQTKRILLVEGSMLRILGLKLPEGFRTYQNLLMDDKDLQALGQAVGTVSDELALRFVAHGTNEILEKIEEFRSVGAKHVTIRFIDETEQSLRRFSEKVLRNFDV